MSEHEARRIILKPDPLGIPRNPLAVYLLVLAFFSGTNIMLGVNASGTMDSALHPWVVFMWGATLVHGSGSTLTGMYWQGDVGTGLVLKRMGMFALTVAAFLYSAVLVFKVGLPSVIPAGITFGFGVACLVQYRVINKRIKAIIYLSQKQAEGSS